MLAVCPESFKITPTMIQQNTYIQGGVVNHAEAMQQHETMCKVLRPDIALIRHPDAVFAANAALSLQRLPESVVILSNMKYASRKRESPAFKRIFETMGIKVIPFEGDVFEGQGEATWFHGGHLLLVGYGFRSTAATVSLLRRLLTRVYNSYNVAPPRVIGVELACPYYYHLDVAMLPIDDNRCIVHAGSFSKTSLRTLRSLLKVTIINVPDPLCLNAFRIEDSIYVHKLAPDIKRMLQAITHCKIVEINVSEFEKAGGSVRCMIFNLPYV